MPADPRPPDSGTQAAAFRPASSDAVESRAASDSPLPSTEPLEARKPGPPADADVPAEVGPYAILKVQARGGLGEVFLARDATLGRDVASNSASASSAKPPSRATLSIPASCPSMPWRPRRTAGRTT